MVQAAEGMGRHEVPRHTRCGLWQHQAGRERLGVHVEENKDDRTREEGVPGEGLCWFRRLDQREGLVVGRMESDESAGGGQYEPSAGLYLLQLPRKGLQGAQCWMASYSAASAMSQALFKVLRVPGTGDDQLLET